MRRRTDPYGGPVENRARILFEALLEQVDVSALNLDAVEARVSCDLCSMSEIFNGLLDVLETHLARGFARNLPALDVNQLLGIDRGRP